VSGHRYPICPVSGKVRYGERKDIKLEMRRADVDRSRARMNGLDCSRREIRSYQCCDCRGWHLTSKPIRTIQLVPAMQIPVHVQGRAAQGISRIAAASGFRVGAAA
jgi:hypothetical protein